jgi:hypothetical protein
MIRCRSTLIFGLRLRAPAKSSTRAVVRTRMVVHVGRKGHSRNLDTAPIHQLLHIFQSASEAIRLHPSDNHFKYILRFTEMLESPPARPSRRMHFFTAFALDPLLHIGTRVEASAMVNVTVDDRPVVACIRLCPELNKC